ncbi:helix-turn-helix domain-containing protein [Lentilactobacillus sunkii]|uniref:HTH araC/xylS-type domain-containing protein n=1 Tax=Lentilactobacillus sunkii DSM 19904 TaxID=1423808 RepID=A0A0R1L8P1_9LACO|nr:helix-turn-helix domain-containing protein [Lentilactobacillus sunkii]KRK89588.1 hypothetical protein FD17_GL001178 [Lentilactobacillus sunkii DSM 19904]
MIKAHVVRDTFIRTELNYIDHPQAQRDMHYHPECELMLILDGDGEFIYNGRTYPAQPGSLFIIKPNIPHRIDMMNSKSHTRIVIEFDGNYTDTKMKELIGFGTFDFFDKFTGVYQLPSSILQNIQRTMTVIVDEQINKRPGYLEMIVCKLCQLFLQINRDVKSDRNRKASSPEQLVQTAIEYIEEHPAVSLSLADISKELFVTREYLSRMFKKYKNTTVQKYINLSKSRTAKELLNSTEDSIAKIADELGFQSTSYFSTVFKNETGMSPRKYREFVKITNQLENDYNNRNLKSKRLLDKLHLNDE